MRRVLILLIGLCWALPASAQLPPNFNLRVASDTTNPTITITSPADDPHDNGTTQLITIAGDVSDDASVTSVKFSHDQGQTDVDCSFSTTFSCSVTLLQDGSPTTGDTVITVTARDAAGNSATDQITVTVDLSGGGSESFGVIYNQTFEGCAIVNAWDGANWTGTQVTDAYWTDTKSYSLCGAGDNLTWYGAGAGGAYFGGATGTPGSGVYAASVYEGTECPGNQGVTNRCVMYRPGEGENANQSGNIKYSVAASTTTTSIYISHVFSFNSAFLWKSGLGGSLQNEPLYIKHVDVNNDPVWGTGGGTRVIQGWGQGGQCMWTLTGDNYASNCTPKDPDTGSSTSTPWASMSANTAYCLAIYIDYPTDTRKAWIGQLGGTMYQIQNTTARDLHRGDDTVDGIVFDTNQRDPEVNGNTGDSDQTTSAGRAGKIWIDNLIVATQEDPNHNCRVD